MKPHRDVAVACGELSVVKEVLKRLEVTAKSLQLATEQGNLEPGLKFTA